LWKYPLIFNDHARTLENWAKVSRTPRSKGAFPGQEDWIRLPVQTPDSGDVSHHPFPDEVNHFVDCILNGTPCIVDIDDAMKTFEIIEAADRSARNHGAPVRLPLEQ